MKKMISVSEFMEALLPFPHYEALQTSTLSSWLDGEYKAFSETFKGYAVWFNHVIRVDSSEMLSAVNLWKSLREGPW